MFYRHLSFGLICAVFFSCSNINLKESLYIDSKTDWLTPNGNPERTNISQSGFSLEPPYKLVWDFSTEASYPVNNIVVSDGLLFLSNLKGEIYAINVNSGSKAGSFSFSSPSSVNGSLIYKNSLIVALTENNGNSIIQYDILNGIEKRSYDLGWIQAVPALSGHSVFIGNMKGILYNINLESANIDWEIKDSSDYKSNQFASSPSVHNNSVYIGNVNGNLYSVNSIDGRIKWKYKTGNSIYAPPSVYNDRIYFASDDLNYYCIDTSGELMWKNNFGTKSVSSSAFDSGAVFVSGVDGVVYAFDINSGNIIWRFQTKGTITAAPLVHKNKIFIGSFDKTIYCLDAGNGKVLWQYQTEGKIRSGIVIWKDLIFAGSDDKSIYCFRQE